MANKRTAELVYNHAAEIAEVATTLQYKRMPELESRYGKTGREKCLQDAGYHLSYLAEAILSESPLLFRDYIGWAQQMLSARNIPAKDLAVNLNCIKEALAQRLPIESFVVAAKYMNSAMNQLESAFEPIESFLKSDHTLKATAEKYLQLLLNGKRNQASQLILQEVEKGVAVKELYLEVFQPVQHEIGRLWQLNKVSVAQEHYCTAATQMIMSQLYEHIFNSERNGYRLVATCISGDLHEVGIRMVADFFEMEGWDTFYLGANTPIESIIRTLREQEANLLIVSATMAYHVRAVSDLIEAIRRDTTLKSVKIMVGGYPFNVAPELWQAIGADAFANNAAAAIEKANDLLRALPLK
ncbi:cobalamin-dependent protein [Adhaeribacter sp. BT258]|uniref:Cobalamin-dependent protein n=1 Tax=Adhaeribacter terrigena TaxID=2793070 RepID=A0ABS1C355_9BACT|nr:cobalamin-dependent protein [Adhaeribacter terrigena]MBK0403828.1 cobalamin-dependent protein [Adhaeribacter terrigena]